MRDPTTGKLGEGFGREESDEQDKGLDAKRREQENEIRKEKKNEERTMGKTDTTRKSQ